MKGLRFYLHQFHGCWQKTLYFFRQIEHFNAHGTESIVSLILMLLPLDLMSYKTTWSYSSGCCTCSGLVWQLRSPGFGNLDLV